MERACCSLDLGDVIAQHEDNGPDSVKNCCGNQCAIMLDRKLQFASYCAFKPLVDLVPANNQIRSAVLEELFLTWVSTVTEFKIRTSKFKTQNSKFKCQNYNFKIKIQNSSFKIQTSKSEIQNSKLEIQKAYMPTYLDTYIHTNIPTPYT